MRLPLLLAVHMRQTCTHAGLQIFYFYFLLLLLLRMH
jgi:hypothetical protein